MIIRAARTAPRLGSGSAQPAVWNMGMELRMASPARMPVRAEGQARVVGDRRDGAAPRPSGSPVVPEVYWIWAGSPGWTDGRSPPRRARSAKSAPRPHVDHFAQLGRLAADLGGDLGHRVAAIFGTWNRPTDRDCSSTNLSSRGR